MWTNPLECGCLNVSFESKWEKKRRERREREREMVRTAKLDLEDHPEGSTDEKAVMSLRVERLERALPWKRQWI